MSNNNVQPIFILPEGSERSQGKNAQKNNILAAKAVADAVRATLGPKGMDKMLVDAMGDIVITNDGVTILEEMEIEHPAAKMIVEVARTQEHEVGDGTTTAVILAGALLTEAEDLLDKNIHPTVIVKGYRLAEKEAQEILRQMGEEVSKKDVDILKKIAMTAMTGKGAESAKELLADITVKAVRSVVDEEDERIVLSENIKVEKKTGLSAEDTELVHGVVLDKERVHPAMPKIVKDAKILIIDAPLEVKSTDAEAKISISNPEQLQAFLDSEERMLKAIAKKIVESGANVVFCQKGIDDLVQHDLAKEGIYACRRIRQSDLTAIANATGASIVSSLDDLSPRDLGKAGLVEEVRVRDEEMTYVRDCKNPKAVSIIVRGSTDHVVDELKRAVTDAIGDVASALRSCKVVAGASAPEMELSKNLRKFASTLSGREQLAVQAFADALEIIPRTLAENAGLDPIDVLTELHAAHDKKQKWAGINVYSGKVMDAWRNGVIEPLKIKTQAIASAAEVAVMILRIDDVIASGKPKQGGNEGDAGQRVGNMQLPGF